MGAGFRPPRGPGVAFGSPHIGEFPRIFFDGILRLRGSGAGRPQSEKGRRGARSDAARSRDAPRRGAYAGASRAPRMVLRSSGSDRRLGLGLPVRLGDALGTASSSGSASAGAVSCRARRAACRRRGRPGPGPPGRRSRASGSARAGRTSAAGSARVSSSSRRSSRRALRASALGLDAEAERGADQPLELLDVAEHLRREQRRDVLRAARAARSGRRARGRRCRRAAPRPRRSRAPSGGARRSSSGAARRRRAGAAPPG